MNVQIYVSATKDETDRLTARGPARDFVELARATGGHISYRRTTTRRSGVIGKLLGPHVRQGWTAAAHAGENDRLFFDGEHIGVPAALFMALRRRRPAHIVVLGHLVARPWKLPMLWLASRLGPPCTLVVHSQAQANGIRPWLGRRWQVRLVPYQVDTTFWSPAEESDRVTPLVLAVGSEHRDHQTLVEAARGLDVRIVIAAGSHWARNLAGIDHRPANVEYLATPLPFAALRDLYRAATVVAVALEDVPNQSGVTTILEAMSCGRPVVVTASRGQRECVVGPLIDAAGRADARATRDRGPQTFDGFDRDIFPQTGFYVPVADADALRSALVMLLGDPAHAAMLGAAGQETALRCFTIDRYTEQLATILLETDPARSKPSVRTIEVRQ